MRTVAHRSIVIIILAGAWLPAETLSQQREAGHELEEIVVTADPLSGADTHLAQPVGVITGEELRRRDIRSIGETVSGEPGVSSSDFGAGVGRPVIRGMSGGRVRVLEDGIGTMDVSTISADHAVSAEPFFAKQVEIFRGPATLLYGSGASGGLVNIATDRILDYVPQSPETELFLQYDTVSEGFTGAGGVSVGAGDFGLHVDGLLRDSQDYEIPGFNEATPDEDAVRGVVPNSDVATENITGSASYIGSRGHLGVSAGRFTNNYGIPGGHHEEEAAGGGEQMEAAGVHIEQEQARYDLKGALDSPLPWLRQIKTRWGYSDYQHDEIEPDGAIGTHFSNEELEGRVEFLHEPFADWSGVAGVQYRDRDFSAVGEEAFLPATESYSVAVFLLEKRDLGDWHIDLGGRYEYQNAAAAGPAPDVDHGVYNVSAGASWEYAPDYLLGGAITRAQRAPSIEELFARGPHIASNTFEIGDPAQDEETSTNLDLYWRREAGRLTFAVNLFYNRVEDFIFQRESDLNGDGAADRVEEDFDGDPAQIVNEEDALLLVNNVQQDAEFYGLELEGDINLFNDAQRGDLHLRLWTDYVRARLDRGGDLPRITPWRVGAGLDYARGPLSASLDYMRVNRQDSTAVLETATPGYHMLEVYAGYTFVYGSSEATVFARGTNLLDEEARRHTSLLKDQAPLPGRSAVLGVRVSI